MGGIRGEDGTFYESINKGRIRAIISSGQAVVLHGLAIMSKDGDWITREDEETTRHILSVLSECEARYRFGAPLDIRWLSHGWSSLFEFQRGKLRVRTDFVSRPPRIAPNDFQNLWIEQEKNELPVVDPKRLADLKRTNREKEYAVIRQTDARPPGSGSARTPRAAL